VWIGTKQRTFTKENIKKVASEFGVVEDGTMLFNKNDTFVRFAAHEAARQFILDMDGALVFGTIIRCNWGHD
jgi:hypothetical protein